jgi:hypothetical protein
MAMRLQSLAAAENESAQLIRHMKQPISEERKIAYYFGTVLMVIGGLLFISVFITGVMNFGDFSNFESNVKSSMFRAISGMCLMIVGGIVRGIGACGLAGSGVVLDPEKAREELGPYSRMTGGMIKDALDEAEINLGGQQEKIIMIKCQGCGNLNEEDSNFCKKCGKKL